MKTLGNFYNSSLHILSSALEICHMTELSSVGSYNSLLCNRDCAFLLESPSRCTDPGKIPLLETKWYIPVAGGGL